MIHFKVIKGSHLLLAFSVAVLAAVLIFICLDGASGGKEQSSVPEQTFHREAKAIAAFASNDVAPLQVEIVPDAPSSPSAQDAAGRILIYHTHTHEAYEQTSEDPYEAVETWRTEDAQHSVVRLGAMLAEELRLKGYNVIHDTTDHEQDSINDAYVRSLKTLEGYAQEFDLCIDLHRDAYSEGLKTCYTDEDGSEYAQLMMLVGRGDAYSGEEKPDYSSNLAFAQTLTGALNVQKDGICRNVTVKTGRYNQHIGKNNILVEVGHNQNTLNQALASIPCLAEGIHQTLLHKK